MHEKSNSVLASCFSHIGYVVRNIESATEWLHQKIGVRDFGVSEPVLKAADLRIGGRLHRRI